jgi:hypothetical protein
MTSQGTAHGRFQRAIHRRHVQAAEMAAREMGGLSLSDALSLCELLANVDPARYERAALRWMQRFIDERLPPLTEVALAASALAELRHGHRRVGVEVLLDRVWPTTFGQLRIAEVPGINTKPPDCQEGEGDSPSDSPAVHVRDSWRRSWGRRGVTTLGGAASIGRGEGQSKSRRR